MQIVLIEPDSNFRDIIDINLSDTLREFNIDIVPFSDVNEAWNFIQILVNVRLIICKDNFDGDYAADFIAQSLKSKGLDISLLSLGEDIKEPALITKALPENCSAEDIAKESLLLIEKSVEKKIAQKKIEDLRNRKYKSIPIKLFRYFNKVPFDFYIRIKKEDKYQFIKRINKNETYDKDMIDQYIEKKLTHFFIDKGHYQTFTKQVNENFKRVMTNIQINGQTKEEIQKYVLIQLSSTGFSESNLNIAMMSIRDQTDKVVSSESKMKFLAEVYNSQLGFRFKRNYMISVIGSLLLENLEWANAKHAHYLSMAAYVHDMYLESEEEMDISSDLELEQYTKDKTVKERIYNHAKLAADKASSLNEIPLEVVHIVNHHHGKANGYGYTTYLGPQIKKLSIAFIVAEEVSVSILKSPRKKINLNGVFNEIIKKYHENTDVKACLASLSKAIS